MLGKGTDIACQVPMDGREAGNHFLGGRHIPDPETGHAIGFRKTAHDNQLRSNFGKIEKTFE